MSLVETVHGFTGFIFYTVVSIGRKAARPELYRPRIEAKDKLNLRILRLSGPYINDYPRKAICASPLS